MFETFRPYFIWRYNVGSETYILLELISGHPEELNSSCSKDFILNFVVQMLAQQKQIGSVVNIFL
jgi:hypothetical protein